MTPDRNVFLNLDTAKFYYLRSHLEDSLGRPKIIYWRKIKTTNPLCTLYVGSREPFTEYDAGKTAEWLGLDWEFEKQLDDVNLEHELYAY